MEIRPGRYVSHIYFLYGDRVKFDVMGFLFRDPDEPFHLLYRFRYDGPDQDKGPLGDGDTKSWTEIVFKGDEGGTLDEDQAIDFCATVFGQLAERGGLEISVLHIQSDDPEKTREALRAQPWAHMMFPKKGAEA